MPRYRHALPQLGPEPFLTDGGLETTLIYRDGLALPDFAAFLLLASDDGRAALRRYFRSYAELAQRHHCGLVLESPTWRASPDWAARQQYSPEALAAANRAAIELLAEVRNAFDSAATPVVVSGCLGPRGDGYQPGRMMDGETAADYHAPQLQVFADSEADMASAITMNYAEEAIGIARAAQEFGLPVAISFTVETDGRLPTGQELPAAIAAVDAATGTYPAYYMINCAHPSHFEQVLAGDAPWTQRLRGLRANASRKSHAELDAATALDSGDPAELARDYLALVQRLPHLNVLGGCCGTDTRHIDAIATECLPVFRQPAA
ncbi:MAG: homocysteine methyltransferase [Moraxellaceae bacterium]|jgi:homocysteine S-methyltransferase|nr:homocysteine methyltransferase [Moraxellaceae bacterium]